MKRASFIWSLTGVAAMLGFMLTVQLSTEASAAKTSAPPTSYLDLLNQINVQSDQNQMTAQQIAQVKEQLSQFQSAGTDTTDVSAALQQDTQKVDAAAGLTPVTGPGLTITIQRDPKLQLSPLWDPQYYMSFVVNILFSDGATAIAVNDYRLTTISTIRDVDSWVDVNGQLVMEPYTLTAVGDEKNMQSVLDVENVVSLFQSLGYDCTITQSTQLTVPAYSGAMPGQYAKEVTSK